MISKRLVMLVALAGLALPGWSQSYSAFDTLLKKHVFKGEASGIKTTLVNYRDWANDPLHDEAMAEIANVKPGQLKGADKMAYWINVYNLLTIDLIIREQEKESIKNLGGFIQSPWKKHEWGIAGKRYSLDHIEHDILRPMGDPRIHMAINCASVSCPDLRREAYRPQKLDEQLEEQVMVFLYNSGKGLQEKNGEWHLSKIFDWFGNDFNSRGGVLPFIQSYRPDVEKPSGDYLDYDWRLNGVW